MRELEGRRGEGGQDGGGTEGRRRQGARTPPHILPHLLRATSVRTGHPHLVLVHLSNVSHGPPGGTVTTSFLPSLPPFSTRLSNQQMTVGFVLCVGSPHKGEDPEEDRRLPEILELPGLGHRMGTMRVFSGGEKRAGGSRGFWSEPILRRLTPRASVKCPQLSWAPVGVLCCAISREPSKSGHS